MRMDHILAGVLFLGAALFAIAGSGLSVIYYISALSHPDFRLSEQAYQGVGFWVLVYTYIPAILLFFISYMLHQVRWRLFFVGALMSTVLAFCGVSTMFFLQNGW
ncbi:MAG: hypothetical protein ACI82N_000779 [Maricaulis sp.]|jgi:hypothetical protein